MSNDAFKKGLAGLDQGPGAGAQAAGEAPEPAGALPPHPSVEALREQFGDAVRRHEVVSGDEHVVFVAPERILEILRWLRDAEGHRYDLLKDVTAVDHANGVTLQLVYEIWSLEHRRQLRVKAEVPLGALEVDSVYYVWRAADWLEREVFDLFGIVFRGHPDLRRIMMPNNYAEGHPLRKDFPLRGRFSRAEQTRRALSLRTIDHYSPYEIELARRLGQPLPAVLGETQGAGEPQRGMPGVGGH